jgi:hypothetical protein
VLCGQRNYIDEPTQPWGRDGSSAPPVLPATATPPWAEGYIGRIHGLSRRDNPYLGCADFREDNWDDGWLYADESLQATSALVGLDPGRSRR